MDNSVSFLHLKKEPSCSSMVVMTMLLERLLQRPYICNRRNDRISRRQKKAMIKRLSAYNKHFLRFLSDDIVAR
jgi:hypothetical protein